MFRVCLAVLSVHCILVVTCWETAKLFALLCVMFSLGQVCYMIPDLCLLPNFNVARFLCQLCVGDSFSSLGFMM